MNEIKFILKDLSIMLGIVASIIFFIFYIYFPFITNHGETITVPNLVGMEIKDLDEFLSDRDLRYEILDDSSYSSEYPPYTVLQQNPSINDKVKENRKIYLTLNSSIPPKIKMPKIINGSVKNAQLILKSYDLKLGDITYVPDMARNAVLKIFIDGDSISENDLILKGSVVDLEVGNGLGNQIFDAPDLQNLELDEAKFTIIGSGLRLGNIIYADSGYFYNKNFDEEGNEIYEKFWVKPGYVFKQSPGKSTRVRIGRRINLWVVSDTKNEKN